MNQDHDATETAIFEISRGSRSPGAPMATRCLVGLLQVLRGWAGRLLGG